MSNFPSQLDDDVTLPPVNDNITETGAEAINAVRDAVFAVETEIGLGASGSAGSIAARLGVSLDPAGAIKPSAIAAMGLVTLPIFNSHISDNAQIVEAKLKLDFRTQDLYNYITDLAHDVNESIGWIDVTGIKLDPHIYGAIYRHQLSDIDVNTNTGLYLKNKFDLLRDNTNAYTLINDINNDLIQHQKADGSLTSSTNVTTFNGSVYPSNYAHLADGIFLNTSRFSTISQTADSVQKFADYIDAQSIFLYGTRIQNLYSNGISRTSRSSSLSADGYGSFIVPPTTAITYLLNNGTSSTPVDSIDTGDDIIEFKPSNDALASNIFDTQFALVKPGDIVRVDYGGIQVPFVIKEKKYIQGDSVKKFVVRIHGKNLFYRTNASARIDKPLFTADKYGVLAVSGANNEFSSLPSLIVSSPRAAVALGLGFDPQLLDNKHYLLYLALFPTGHPTDGYTILPGIDVTGNQGTTPGAYTLDSVVEATNDAFRKKGYNYRFVAFQYKGEFGIMLADSINNAGFSILSGVVNDTGGFEQSFTDVFFPNNVVGIFGVNGKVAPDPLGFGPNGSAVASPPYQATYLTPEQALIPTKLFLPLKRNNYYVNGNEIEKLEIDVGQARDGYGDGYWVAEIIDRVVFPGNRVKVSYRIDQDLSTSKLKVGKTVVVQSDGYGSLVDFGRFIIESIAFNTCPGTGNTDFSVYDAIHATGISPSSSLGTSNFVKVYFSSDSVEFNTETSTDETSITPSFKRHFEVLADQNGDVFTHERARMNINGSNITVNGVTLYGSAQLSSFDIVKVAPKLRGYKFFFGTTAVNKINLNITSYSATTGVYSGNLAMWDGVSFTRLGPTVTSRVGELTRFYDESNVDYIDVIFNFANSGTFTGQNIDIQLFPTLQLDEELFPIATCQVNDVTGRVEFIRDIRDFGNVSEKQLTTSALNYISATDKLLHGNGVVRGFDVTNDSGNPIKDQIRLSGGVALVNGNVVMINNNEVSIPIVVEKDPSSSSTYQINWALCVNDKNEYQTIPLLDTGLSSSNRTFLVKNPITSGTYNIDAILFSDLINKRKDLCILYIVASTVTGTGLSTDITVSISDVRRYVTDQDTLSPSVITNANAQGNFKDFSTAVNWLRYNNTLQNSLAVKGAQSVATNPNFSNLKLNIYSQGAGASLTFGTGITVSSFNFKDLATTVQGSLVATDTVFDNCSTVNITSTATLTNTTFNGGVITITSNAQFENCIFNNCSITIGGNLSSSMGNVQFNNCNIFVTGTVSLVSSVFTGGSLVASSTLTLNLVNANRTTLQAASALSTITSSKFKNCTLTLAALTSTNTSTNNSVFEYCTVTCSGVATLTWDKFITCNLTFSAGGTFSNVLIDPSTITIGASINVSDTTIIDSTISVSSVNGFALGNNFNFLRNTVTWTGTPVSNYTSTDLVNSANGMMYVSVGATTISNIRIESNTFNLNMQDHFPFVSFQLTSYSSVIRSISVSKNKFTSTMNADDVRAVVAVVATLATPATPTTFPQYPVMIDVHFDENICNYNQMFIITGLRNQTTGIMSNAYPVCNDVTISRNICGTIGYFISAVGPYDGSNVGSPNNGIIRDKANKLIIEENYCKFISNLDAIGDYICFRATRFPSNNTYEEVTSSVGEASILRNSCNWIQVGAGGYSSQAQSGVNIIGNTVCPASPSFLSNFTGFILQSVTPANVGILLRREHNAIGSSSSIIAENNIVQKFSTTGSGATVVSNATNASPIVITTTATHGYVTGQSVSIADVLGNTAANGNFIITVLSGTTFSLNGSTGNGAYTDGGTALASTIYYYDAGMVVFNNARIMNNVIAGVVNSTTAPLMYFWDINSQIVTGNILERRGLTCNAYFFMDGLSSDGTAAQKLLISHNTFDNVDGLSLSPPSSALVNRYFIVQNPSGTTGYATGASASTRQTGFRIEKNIGGTQAAGFVFV